MWRVKLENRVGILLKDRVQFGCSVLWVVIFNWEKQIHPFKKTFWINKFIKKEKFRLTVWRIHRRSFERVSKHFNVSVYTYIYDSKERTGQWVSCILWYLCTSIWRDEKSTRPLHLIPWLIFGLLYYLNIIYM